MLGFTDNAFGLWAGTAINDTSSVVAAGYAYSNSAGAYATIVKLARTTMIIPVSLAFSLITASKKRKMLKSDVQVNYSLRKIFPWFILWFLTASMLNTLGIFPEFSIYYINLTGKFMIIMALTAIGLNSNFKKMLKAGFKPMLLGLIVWITVAASSIFIQYITKQI
jgi:uncharacterized membrane protein YadS